MDSLTAAVALVIDNDQGELESVCRLVREYIADMSEDDPETREYHVRADLAEYLRSRVAELEEDKRGGYGLLPRMFLEVAVSHMYTHTDWRALADHYMQKVAEGV